MQSMQRPFAVISYELQDSMGLPRNYKDSPGFSLELIIYKDSLRVPKNYKDSMGFPRN